MDKDLGSVGGLSRLLKTTFNLLAALQWSWVGDHISRFFLLVKLFESYSEIKTQAAQERVRRWRPEVEALVERMEGVREKRTKEEANQLAEQICMLMMAIIEQNFKLNPAEHDSIHEYWKRAKEDSRKLEEAKKKLPPAPSRTTTRRPPAPTSTIKLTVHVCPINNHPDYAVCVSCTRTLAFPTQFADYSLCPLIFYSLSHPRPTTGADILPFTIQAMDTVYLRFLQSSDNPAIWGPLDPCSPVTLSQYYEKSSQAEVRFVRCKIRFLLVSTYHSGTHRERVFDLDSFEQRRRLLEVLIRGPIDAETTPSAPTPATPSSAGSESQSLPDGTAFENIMPRTCFVLKRANIYESFHPMHPSVDDLSFIA